MTTVAKKTHGNSQTHNDQVPWWKLPGGISNLKFEDRTRLRDTFEIFMANKRENGAKFFAKFV